VLVGGSGVVGFGEEDGWEEGFCNFKAGGFYMKYYWSPKKLSVCLNRIFLVLFPIKNWVLIKSKNKWLKFWWKIDSFFLFEHSIIMQETNNTFGL
jgi:hypothetical protein